MKKAWLMVVIAILTGLVFTMGLFKIPPIMVLLMQDYKVGIAVIGLVMTAFALSSTIIALPGGAIIQKVGVKNAGLLSVAFALVGNILGVISGSFTMLVISRLIEGLGYGLISIVIPAIIAMWFPAEKRGFPMGIFTLWVSIGMLIILNLTNIIVPGYGWRGSFWLITALLVLMGIIFALVIRVPKEGEGANEPKSLQPLEKFSVWEGFKSPGAWLLGLIFFAYSWPSVGYSGFYPTYLTTFLGLDLVTANKVTSFGTWGMIVGGVLVGLVLNRIKNKNHSTFLITIMALSTVFFFFLFRFSSVSAIVPFILIFGIVNQFVPPALFTMAPGTATRPETVAATMGIINLGANLGGIVGNTFTGPMVQSFGGDWSKLSLFMLVIALVGVAASIVLKLVTAKRAKAIHESL
ncbi:MFS transporter [Dehalobacter sp. DCM]|uniref:MFS transporter n=1 Tax=Dehalobacter sp. DCM TaxID=2907827 RepID=UPI00308127DA|nr:MFS transporter [Dehalobacter sp. DCM]